MKFLIAEDDDMGRRVLELFLTAHAQCVKAKDGAEALAEYTKAMTEDEPFDVIFLDIVMPEKNGVEVLQAIRQHEQDNNITQNAAAKVIMLTGQSDTKQVVEAQKLGIEAYLLKPIEEEVLLRSLQHLGVVEDPNDQWG